MSLPAPPSPAEFYSTGPLYSPFDGTGDHVWAAAAVIFYKGTYDSYCVQCGRESTFQVSTMDRPDAFDRDRYLQLSRVAIGRGPNLPQLQSATYSARATCSRDRSHVQYFTLLVSHVGRPADQGGTQIVVQKIGQHPQLADLSRAEHKEFAKVMSSAQRFELNRAMGLAAHGVGVGSYVYLRRIFEGLVEEAHQTAQTEIAEWDEAAFRSMRMHERIAHLKGYLPDFLVEHPGMYSLLSRGIHELTEEDCLAHFATLKSGIELILEEKLHARRRAERQAEARAALAKATAPSNGSNTTP